MLDSAINLGARELTVFARCCIIYQELLVAHICKVRWLFKFIGQNISSLWLTNFYCFLSFLSPGWLRYEILCDYILYSTKLSLAIMQECSCYFERFETINLESYFWDARIKLIFQVVLDTLLNKNLKWRERSSHLRRPLKSFSVKKGRSSFRKYLILLVLMLLSYLGASSCISCIIKNSKRMEKLANSLQEMFWSVWSANLRSRVVP